MSLAGQQPRTQAPYVVVFRGESSFMFELPGSGDVLIGRSTNAEIQLDNRSTSRRHALLRMLNGEAQVVDLGSQNGTLVNDERVVGWRTLLSGDVISIGGVSMVFHCTPRRKPRNVAIELDEFRAAIEEEIERCAAGRTFALLSVGTHDEALPQELPLRGELRSIDRVVRVTKQRIFVLLPEVEPDEAAVTAKRLGRQLRTAGVAPRIGYSVFPRDGGSSDTLLASARSAMEAAKDSDPVSAQTAFKLVELGERTAIVADESMVRLYALLKRLASSDLAVLVMGETGTGKELAAAALHHFSQRRDKPMVALNCAAMQETLVESELFGHEKGAFSGATSSKTGLLESGDGGTVFLDEIGELPLTVQAKLLRALENKRFTRVGGLREKQVDVRFVAATNRNLQKEVEAGRFRADLFYRLNVAMVYIPPLRDRGREIPILAHRFMEEECQRSGRGSMSISADAMQVLISYDWPGNVRELRNTIVYLVATTLDDEIDDDSTVEYLSRNLPLGASLSSSGLDSLDDDAGAVGDAAAEPPVRQTSPKREFRPLKDELRELEQTRISEALEATGGNQTRAAKLISMPLRTFIAKGKKYGLLGKK